MPGLLVLVTRPPPDNETTAASLRARGYGALLAPMLRYEPAGFIDDPDTRYGGVIVSSANAIRALDGRSGIAALLKLPLYAVGKHTAEAARAAGFRNVVTADGDAPALRETILAGMRAKMFKKSAPLLYLAGADLARDLSGELAAHGIEVVTKTTYRMTPVLNFPAGIRDALAAGRIEAVLHYSRRSAQAFFAATRTAGIEITALAIVQCCLSDAVAAEAREAGAARVAVARKPDESALFEALDRAFKPLPR